MTFPNCQTLGARLRADVDAFIRSRSSSGRSNPSSWRPFLNLELKHWNSGNYRCGQGRGDRRSTVTGLEEQSRPPHSSPTKVLTAPTSSWTPGFPNTSGLYWNRAWACLGRKAEWGVPLSEPGACMLDQWGKLRAANVTRCSTKSRNPYPVTGAQVIAAPNRPRPPARARLTQMLRDATRNQEIRAL